MIGDVLKKLRLERKLTSEELCNKIGIKGGSYRNYERNDRKPDYDTLVKLADFYGVTTDYLLGRDQLDQPPIDQLEKQFNMSVLEKRIINNYLSLPKELRSDLMDFLQKSLKEAVDTENAK